MKRRVNELEPGRYGPNPFADRVAAMTVSSLSKIFHDLGHCAALNDHCDYGDSRCYQNVDRSKIGAS